jgi:hypothetical protein
MAPFSSRRRDMDKLPDFAERCNDVIPSGSTTFTFTPLPIRRATTASFPLLTAICRAVDAQSWSMLVDFILALDMLRGGEVDELAEEEIDD